MPDHNFNHQTIQLNCDMGEGMGNDAAIMPYISAANIACGFHAGDEDSIRQTIQLAIQYDVAIGAHVSFYDRENFGRTEIHLPAESIYRLVIEQLEIMQRIAKEFNVPVHHVKPHGALYNMSAKDTNLATAIAMAVKEFDPQLVLYGLSGSHSITAARVAGLEVAAEVFGDRTYQDDATLTLRVKNNALINDREQMIRQVIQIVKDGGVSTISGRNIKLQADTICLHGDNPYIVEWLQALLEVFREQQVIVKKFNYGSSSAL